MTDEILTFSLCNNTFGIDVKLVKEINRKIEYTIVPGAPPHIAGLYNMRGQIVTLINLAKVIMPDECIITSNPECIILKPKPSNPDYVGFLVHKIKDKIDIEDKQCEPLPSNTIGVETKSIKGVFKLENMLVTMIDPEKIIE